MNRSISSFATLLTAAAVLASSTAAHATQGYFTIGTGAVSDGLAGAGVALPQDATIGAANPAGIVRVGNQYSLGVALFQPSREYSVTGNPSGAPGTFGLTPGTVKSHNDSFGIPNLAYTHRLTDTSSFGLNIYANGGLNTSYPGSAGSGAGTFYGGPAGVNLEQLFFVPSYSVALSKSWAVGASIVGAYQVFSASGLKNFGAFVADGNPDHLTDQGNDSSWSVGGKLGVLYDASPTLSLGAAYQTKTSGSKFSKYSDLFAGRGTFNIPSSTTVGLAWKTSPSSLVAADVQLIKYSDIPAVSNPFSNLTSGSATKLLGGDDGAGFGWRDTTFYKVGYQKDVSQSWTLRGGVAYGKQPIRSSEVVFNILAPGVTEWHYAIGATGKVSKKAKVNVAITYSPSTSVSGSNPLEAPGQQTVALSMKQFQVNASYGVSY